MHKPWATSAGGRAAVRRVIIYAAAIAFAAATVHRFHWLGGPYFELLRD